MNWMRHLEYEFDKYIGVDVVVDLIHDLQRSLQSNVPFRHFQVGDITTDVLPHADAILCRDCLVHLPFDAIQRAIRLWQIAGFRYALVTTFPERSTNADCEVGEWRPLNMQAPPFDWGTPLMLINEEHDRPYQDKSVGVWTLSYVGSLGKISGIVEKNQGALISERGAPFSS
jgi:hypothetical protein